MFNVLPIQARVCSPTMPMDPDCTIGAEISSAENPGLSRAISLPSPWVGRCAAELLTAIWRFEVEVDGTGAAECGRECPNGYSTSLVSGHVVG